MSIKTPTVQDYLQWVAMDGINATPEKIGVGDTTSVEGFTPPIMVIWRKGNQSICGQSVSMLELDLARSINGTWTAMDSWLRELTLYFGMGNWPPSISWQDFISPPISGNQNVDPIVGARIPQAVVNQYPWLDATRQYFYYNGNALPSTGQEYTGTNGAKYSAIRTSVFSCWLMLLK